MLRATSFVNSNWLDEEGRQVVDVKNPYSGEIIGKQIFATEQDVELALQCAQEARMDIANIPVYKRAEILMKASDLLASRKEHFAELIATELGKPLKNTLDEVARSIETLQLSAEEAKRLNGETIDGSASERGVGSQAIIFRVPVGVVAAITPFNAPLNLVCHKIGPAFGVGNVTILKPAPQTALIATAFVELLLEAGFPKQAIQMVLGGVEPGQKIVEDSRVQLISFTGGLVAANHIVKAAGLKKTLFELGGNAATIVAADADIERAAKMCAQTGYSNSGQSCISVQRIYVESTVVDSFVGKLIENVEKLVVGNPLDPSTDIGTMVDEQAANRVMQWITEAVEEGAQVLTGAKQTGANITPTVLLNPKKQSKVVCQEVFGPLVSVMPIQSFEEGIEEANDSQFGLQVGIFTNDFNKIQQAIHRLEAGGIIVNGTSNYRLDHWPYGGVKNSGIGREGPRFAMEEMSEMKMVVIRS